jgi:Fe2+ transport system protein FeoA
MLGSAAQRLIDIGFREGQRVTCLMRPGFGAPRVYAVGGATYSLDQRTASVVFVSPESSA